MDTQEYIAQLKLYIAQFVDWWCKPYERFFNDYDKQNRSFIARLIPIRIDTREGMAKFNNAAKQFEKDVRQKYDLIDEIFEFFDDNYETYLHATDAERDEIRSIIGNSFYKGPDAGITHYMGNYMALLLLDYVTDHVVTELNTSGDEAWLIRGLVAISMENCFVDYRDTITCIARIYVAAEKKGLNPKTAFQRVAEISSKKIPRGGESSVSAVLAAINEYVVTNYRGLFR